MPWLRWDRGPGAPHQAVLVDLAHERLYFFFIEIWPQEVYYITGLLILAAVALFLINALFGRLWCGYSCPQTVWTDLFIWVETKIEGDRGARIRLAAAPWTLGQDRQARLQACDLADLRGGDGRRLGLLFQRRAHACRIICSRASASFGAYAAIAGLAFTTYSLGGLMREQVCTYMCPWPRIQAAMTDDEALSVTYRARSRRTARRSQERASPGRGAAAASTAINASRPVRWASIFATAPSSNASIARYASMPATM